MELDEGGGEGGDEGGVSGLDNVIDIQAIYHEGKGWASQSLWGM